MTKKRIDWKTEGPKWAEIYGNWKESGLTQDEYCDQNGVKASEFKMRTKALWDKGFLDPDKKPPRESNFVPVQVKTETTRARNPYCEIRFGSGGRIVIEDKSSLEGLRELVGVLT